MGGPLRGGRRANTQACLYGIADATVQIQLISGDDYTPWPREQNSVSLRYAGLADVRMTTYTPAAFVGAKTGAWCDAGRDAPRDLYDLWAMSRAATSTWMPRGCSTGSAPRPATPARGCSRNARQVGTTGMLPSATWDGSPSPPTKPTRRSSHLGRPRLLTPSGSVHDPMSGHSASIAWPSLPCRPSCRAITGDGAKHRVMGRPGRRHLRLPAGHAGGLPLGPFPSSSRCGIHQTARTARTVERLSTGTASSDRRRDELVDMTARA